MREKPIRVMIVEDSATVREFLIGLFSSQPDFEVVATARNGKRALEILRSIPRPDLITMDMHMPIMDGRQATEAIMGTSPAPILVVSSGPGAEEGGLVFQALEAGAVGAVRLPTGPGLPGHRDGDKRLLESARALSEVKVVRRWNASRKSGQDAGKPWNARSALPAAPASGARPHSRARVVALGASTGGPLALKALLGALSPGFPLPILLVQHMAEGFIQSFADWLAESSRLPVKVAADGQAIEPGTVHVARESRHLEIAADETLRLPIPVGDDPYTPSVARLFRSVERSFGAASIACLLTGMGKDGAAELASLKRAGALTLAQDEASSTVFGMPGEAVRLGGAAHVLPPESLGILIDRMARGDARP